MHSHFSTFTTQMTAADVKRTAVGGIQVYDFNSFGMKEYSV